MARLFTSGFELGSAASAMEWPTAGSFFGGATVGSVGSGYVVHGGSYSLRIDAPTSTVAQGCSHPWVTTNQDIAITRVYIGAGEDWVAPNAKTTVIALFDVALGYRAGIAWDQNGDIYFETEDETLLTINGGAVAPGAGGQIWQAFEILYFRIDGAGNDVIAFRSVGPHEGISPIFTFTGKSFSTGVAILAMGANLRGETCSAGRWYFDDVAINDPTGTSQNSWPGPGMVSAMRIDADGDQANKGTQGTDFDTYPTAGGTAYQQLDETPTPDDDTSALLLLTGASGPTDPPVLDFDLVSASAAGIPANARITAVQVGARYRNINGDNPASLTLRVKSASGGTVEESAPQRHLTPVHVTHRTTVPRNYSLTSYLNPSVAGQPWTPTMLDGAQVGVRMTLPGVGDV